MRNPCLLVTVLLAACSSDEPATTAIGSDMSHPAADMAALREPDLLADLSSFVDLALPDLSSPDDALMCNNNMSVIANPAAFNFGAVQTGKASPAQQITITGANVAEIRVTRIDLGGTNPNEFAFAGPTPPVSLLCMQSRTVRVSFQPLIAGMKSASLSLTVAGFPPVLISLTGVGQ